MSGWIKIHRQITEWEWYDDANTFRLFMHLILKANHKAKNYRGVNIEVGCLMTGRELLSKETGLSIQQIRTCLERLKSTKEITIKTNKQGTIIQILKYEKYQVVTNESTTKQPTSNQQVTINKNEKNEKEKAIPTIEEFLAYALDNKPNVDTNEVRLKYESWKVNDWCVNRNGKINDIKNWKSTLLNTLPFFKEVIINKKSIEQLQYESAMRQMEANK